MNNKLYAFLVINLLSNLIFSGETEINSKTKKYCIQFIFNRIHQNPELSSQENFLIVDTGEKDCPFPRETIIVKSFSSNKSLEDNINICTFIRTASITTNYTKEIMEKYVPIIHQAEPETKKLINCLAYTYINRPTLIKNFRAEVFNYLNNNKLSWPLNCGINIDEQSLPCTISICPPISGAKKLKNACFLFLLFLCGITKNMEIISKKPYMLLEIVFVKKRN